jgi:hypothetical protein
MDGQRQASASLPQGKTRYPLYRRWRSVGSLAHTVASRFTDYATPANPIHVECIEIHYLLTSKAKFTVAISTEYFVFLLSPMGGENGSYGSF